MQNYQIKTIHTIWEAQDVILSCEIPSILQSLPEM